MIRIKHAVKTFQLGDTKIIAINNINLRIKKGEFVAIVGPSGSGKSTLMNVIGLLDTLDSGEYYLDDIEIKTASEDKLAEIRNQKIGFVFQSFNLLAKLTVAENVEIPLIYNGKAKQEAEEITDRLLNEVGLIKRKNHLPRQLSGGQQQRVAIARALSCNPEIILADEPTGALDSKTSKEIISLLISLNKKGQTIVLITHDMNVAKRAKRIINIADGKLYE